MIVVNRNRIHARDDALQIRVVWIHLGGKHDHGVIQSNLGLRGGVLPQRFNTLRNPILLRLWFRLRLRLGELDNGKSKQDGKRNAGNPLEESHKNTSTVKTESLARNPAQLVSTRLPGQ